MPPMVALSGPHPSAATMSGRGARLNSNSEISAPETIEANISADAQPAAMAMRTIAIISCPAPFERLDIAYEFRSNTNYLVFFRSSFVAETRWRLEAG